MPLSLIAHLDADCFYVSAERLRDSFLCGKAVGVLGNQGACVIAKSYEMKAKGVGTGEPIWEAVKKCPEGLYVKRDFRWYEVVSKEILSFVREQSPAVEYYSIDEFFFTVDAADPQRFAESIRDRIPWPPAARRTRGGVSLPCPGSRPWSAAARLENKLMPHPPCVPTVTEVSSR